MSFTAKCQECSYKLYSRGQIGTECFAIRHNRRKNHEIRIYHAGQCVTTYPKRDTLILSERPPF